MVGVPSDNSEEFREALESAWWRETPVAELGPTGFVVIADGRLAHVNRRMTEMLGYAYREMVGRSFLDFVAPQDRPEALRMYQRHVKGERELGVIAIKLATKSGVVVQTDMDGAIFEVSGKQYECLAIHDVTDRVRDKRDLRDTRRRYEQLVENSTDLIGVLVDGRIEFLNRAGSKFLGFVSSDTAENHEFRSWVHPLHQAIWDEWIQTVENGAPTAGGVLRLQINKGRYRDVALTLNLVSDDEGKKVHVVARDVTQSMRTAAALEQKDTLLGAVVRASHDAIVVIGDNGAVRLFNPAAEAMFGRSSDEIVGKSVSLLVPAHLRKTHEQYTKEFFQTGVSRGAIGSTLELTAEKSDGTRFPIELSLSSGRAGVHGFVMAVIRDVTYRREAISALSESESRFRMLFDQVGDAVYLFPVRNDGFPGRIMAVNTAAVKRLNYTREEFRAMTPSDVHETPDGQAAIENVMERLLSNGSAIFERTEIAKGGKRIPVEISAQLFQMEGKKAVLSVARDITERRRIDELMRRTQADLEDKVKDRTKELQEAYHSLEEQYRRRMATEQELIDSERMLTAIIGNLPGMAYRFPADAYRRLTFVSEGCVDLTGFDAHALSGGGTVFEEFVHPEDRQELRRTTEDAVKSGRPFRSMYRIQTSHGTEKWVWEQGRVATDPHGRAVVEGFVTDMTERKRQEDRLQQLATRDFLTGLYNRRYFWEQLERHFKEARKTGRQLVLGIGDLDRFKEINDRLGHHAGDQVLERFGDLARREIRARDFAGRYGGDEFVIVFPDCGLEEAGSCVDRIREKFLGVTGELVGPDFPLPSVSFGLAGLDKRHKNETELLEHADKLLYQAKNAGRNRTVISTQPLWSFE